MTTLISVVLGLVFTLAILQAIAVARFKNLGATLMDRVLSGPPPVARDVPPVIRRFAERAGAKAGHLTRSVHLTQTAEMRLDRGGDWQPITAVQVISTGSTGFVWLAAQYIGPLIKFRVIDAFVAGKGRLNVRVFGSIPVADASGTAFDIGEAMRYLSELVWAPDAMLGHPGLIWTPHEDGSVSVAIELEQGTPTVTFLFDASGDIVAVHAKDRPAEVKADDVVTYDWRIAVQDYRELGGRRVPTRAEVGYVYDDGYEAYWRGEVTSYQTR